MTSRKRCVIAAYACEPHRGSEPSVGWNLAIMLSRHLDVWVLTRSANRPAIEKELAGRPVPGLTFVYYELPRWARFWKVGTLGTQIYSYLWQVCADRTVRRLEAEIGFDLAQHATFMRYWAPSCLRNVRAPLFWGPVGGGDTTPAQFRPGFGWRGHAAEILRDCARWVGEHDPVVLRTARRCAVAIAATEATAARLKSIGARNVLVHSDGALTADEIQRLSQLPYPPAPPMRFISIGRLLPWKGAHIGLLGFARAGIADSEYWIVGEGPARARLERIAKRLGIADRVRFLGVIPRTEVFDCLAASHAMVHPSFHDLASWACVEAMAAGRPVICLDTGGLSLSAAGDAGIRVALNSPEEVVERIAASMRELADDPAMRERMSRAARRHIASNFTWNTHADWLLGVYREVTGPGGEETDDDDAADTRRSRAS